MTCAQGLLRLLWGGGPKLECYGTVAKDFTTQKTLRSFTAITISNEGKTKSYIVFTVLPLFWDFLNG